MSKIGGTGAVARISTLAGATGTRTPIISANSAVCGPAAATDDIGTDSARSRLNGSYFVVENSESCDCGVLVEPASQILEAPSDALAPNVAG